MMRVSEAIVPAWFITQKDGSEGMMEIPNSRPVQELVRCRNCIFNPVNNPEMPFACSIKDMFAYGNEDWFCGDGRRKNGSGYAGNQQEKSD